MRLAKILPFLVPLVWACTGRTPTDSSSRPASPASPKVAKLRSMVEFLASPEMRGRLVGTPENHRAAGWIAGRFEEIGLGPVGGGSWFHDFKFRGKTARNVAGILRPETGRDEYVIVAAHHDGLGTRGGKVFAGADDNASGVAAVLLLAEMLAGERARLRRNVVFVSFDAEEKGMVGSRHFVSRGVIPLETTRFMMVFDLLAGRFVPWDQNRVYVMGSEHCPEVRRILEQRIRESELDVRIFGTWILEPAGPLFARSDYQAYRVKGVPYLFLSTATPWYYHTVHDTPARLDYEKLARNVQFAHGVLLDIANTDTVLEFQKRPEPELNDAASMLELIQGFFEHDELLRDLGPDERKATEDAMTEHLEKLRGIADRGSINRGDRRTVHRALMTIFKIVSRYRPR